MSLKYTLKNHPLWATFPLNFLFSGAMIEPGRSRGPTPQDLRKERPPPHMGDPRGVLVGSGGPGYPPQPVGSSRDMDMQQELPPRRPDPLEKGPHGYKGDPRDFDPGHRSRPDSYQRSTAEPPGRQMAAPPPAHSHHHSGVPAGHSGAQDLGKPSGHRPDSRNKSPSMYQVSPTCLNSKACCSQVRLLEIQISKK